MGAGLNCRRAMMRERAIRDLYRFVYVNNPFGSVPKIED